MVIYNLICRKQHRFEGWFPSYEEYQQQAAGKQIACPTCGSKKIERMPHACAVHVKKEIAAPRSKTEADPAPEPAAPPTPMTRAEFNELLIRVHHHVKENYENVGDRFAREARQIHNGESTERPIYGTATAKDAKELIEDGVPFIPLPKPELDS